MKLYFTPTSPFVRKVLVVVHELGLRERVETELLRPAPTQADPVLSGVNPLNKIPALVLEGGGVLYDSPVICEYLDVELGGRRLIPEGGAERWRVLRQQALSDGILDAGILVFYERQHRPGGLHWQPWLEGQAQKALQGLDALEAEVGAFGEAVDLAQISAATALGWLEFRAPLGDIRGARPRLFAWYDRFQERPSMSATEPQA
jgi:glutathione S-transferase